MAEIGSLEWVSRVKGAAEAKRQANEIADVFDSIADEARAADEAIDSVGATSTAASDGLSQFTMSAGLAPPVLITLVTWVQALITGLGDLTGDVQLLTRAKGAALRAGEALGTGYAFLRHGVALLSSGVATLVLRLKTLTATMLTTTAAAGASQLAGALSGLVGLLGGVTSGAAAAGVAVGGFLGVLGVFVLEVTGALDLVRNFASWLGDRLPSWATDGMSALISIVLGPLAVIGAGVLGFVEGYLEGGLQEGFRQAWQRVKEILGVFRDSWSNTLDRLRSVGEGFWGWLTGWGSRIYSGISNRVSDITGRFREFARTAPKRFRDAFVDAKNNALEQLDGLVSGAYDRGVSFVSNIVDGIRDSIPNAESTVGELADSIREYLPFSPAERGALSDLDDVGPGFVDTIASGVESYAPELEGATERATDMMVPETPALGATGGGGGTPASTGDNGGGDATVVIENQIIEVGDQTLDVRDLDRRTLELLGEIIADIQGDDLKRYLGT